MAILSEAADAATGAFGATGEHQERQLPVAVAPSFGQTARITRRRQALRALLALGCGGGAAVALLGSLGAADAISWTTLALWALAVCAVLWPARWPLLLGAALGMAAPLWLPASVPGSLAHPLLAPLAALVAVAAITARAPEGRAMASLAASLSRPLPAALGTGLLRQELEHALGSVPYLTLVRLAPDDEHLSDAAWLAVVRTVLDWKGLRPADYVGVVGERELAIFLPSVDLRAAEATLIRVVQRIDQRTGVGVRVGVAAYPDRGSSADALWDDAGRQLAVARETGAPIVSAAQVEDSEGAAERLADAVDMRLFGEPGHAKAVAELAAQVARQLGLDRGEVAAVRDAAYVRDVGHLGTPDVLLRPGPLSARQRAMVRAHVQRGVDFLSRFPRYRGCLGLVRAHHERPDGTGYPDGLSGKAIPLGAAIIAAADAYRAMLSTRPHRTAYTPEQARAELRAGRGTAWNAEVVDALLVTVHSEARAARARGAARPNQDAALA